MSLIFLSHIHQEKDLALIVQKAIEDEFSGFVDVFVSSDGKTITAGANFLSRIENGLVDCVGAIYLISPKSITRNWINFELGAVWIRNHMSKTSTGIEIPTIPICHSGITPSSLPMPLINLNSVSASDPIHLKSVFQSIQKAVGGKGELKTDFEALSKSIIEFEQNYTIGDSLLKLFKLLEFNTGDISTLIAHSEQNKSFETFPIDVGFRDTQIFAQMKDLERNNLKKYITITMNTPALQFGANGTQNGGNVTISMDPKLILQFQHILKT